MRENFLKLAGIASIALGTKLSLDGLGVQNKTRQPEGWYPVEIKVNEPMPAPFLLYRDDAFSVDKGNSELQIILSSDKLFSVSGFQIPMAPTRQGDGTYIFKLNYFTIDDKTLEIPPDKRLIIDTSGTAVKIEAVLISETQVPNIVKIGYFPSETK